MGAGVNDLIFSPEGKRKYLTVAERTHLLRTAQRMSPHIMTLLWTMAATGLRISEALSITPRNLDRDSGMIVVRCLKKRRDGIFRAVPVPDELLDALVEVHGLGSLPERAGDAPLWPVSRMTAWRWIRGVMALAGIEGHQAMPKGLRHGFGIGAIQSGVPLNMVQRWLGHADIRTTAIYTNAVGPEERSLASAMWKDGVLSPLASESAPAACTPAHDTPAFPQARGDLPEVAGRQPQPVWRRASASSYRAISGRAQRKRQFA